MNDPLFDNNPITVQVLGICSALAVTTQMKPSLVMAIAVVIVLAVSNVVTSLLRNNIPNQVRLIVQLVIIATLVTVVELSLKAISYDIYKQLSVFIGLIITNCIIMGRLEAFAMGNTPWKSFIDGLGNGLGYGLILIVVSAIRELFGKGALMGFPIIAAISWLSWYTPNNLMVLPASALLIIGVMIWIHRSRNPKLVDIS
ncbi:UNVERIFIED_CONTAM: hypothetical protein GTU68_053569 [Idotea baltica]|nr:hypothetical protein [Idotea baltica]